MAEALPRPGGGAPPSEPPVADAAGPHARARALTEQALDKLSEGNDAAAQDLVDQAKRLDPTGAQEVLDDLNEDAADRGETRPTGGDGSVAESAPG